MADARLVEKIEKEQAVTDENKDPCKSGFLKLLAFRAKGYIPQDIRDFDALNKRMESEMKTVTLNTAPNKQMSAICGVLKDNYIPYVRGIAGLFTLSAEASLKQPTPIETAKLSVQRLDDATTRMKKCQASFYSRDPAVAANIQEAMKIQQDIVAFQSLHSRCLSSKNGR